jgi:sortase A
MGSRIIKFGLTYAATRRFLEPSLPGVPLHADHRPLYRIVIRRIGLDADVFEGVDLETLSNGPGHWPGSAQPGEKGNAVIAGHRITWSHPFGDLDLVLAGDRIDVGSSRYVADQVFVVDADATWIADPTPAPTLTLFACHPKGSAAQRIVVKAHLVAA